MESVAKKINQIAPLLGLMVLRKHWDMLKGPIVCSGRNSTNEECTIYKWLDCREVWLTKAENAIYKERDQLNELSRVISNLNPLLEKTEPLKLKVPKLSQGICIDQYGNLFSYSQSNSNNIKINHIACSFQSPLFKYDGENFIKENILRRIPPVLIENKEYVYFKDLPEVQQIQFSKKRPNYVSEKILFDEYGSWHYYWYEENKSSLFARV
jgi:hypothetical protein